MSKNILEVSLSPDLGGLELFMVQCYEYFKQKGNVKIVVAPHKKLDAYLHYESQKIYVTRNKFFPVIPALKLAKIIDKYDIDIVHFHWTKDIATVVLGKLMSKKKPKIIQSRHMTMTRFKDDFYHRWLYKNIDMMHAVTYQVKEQLEKFIPKDIRPDIVVVHSGVQEPTVDPLTIENLKEKYQLQKSFTVGIVGRIEEKKGQWIVIEALAKLKKMNMKALIIGHAMDEEYLDSLKKKVLQIGMEEKIIFTGFTKDVNEHIKLCDVTVLATPKETFGLVVIESMINSVPVIATKNGGPLEIIEDGVDGIFFNRSIDDLVQKIQYLYENEEIVEKLSKNAYKKVKSKFDKEKQLEQLYRFIEEEK